MAFFPHIVTFSDRNPSALCSQVNAFLIAQSQADSNGAGNVGAFSTLAVLANPRPIYTMQVGMQYTFDANTIIYTPTYIGLESDDLEDIQTQVNALTSTATFGTAHTLIALLGVQSAGSPSFVAVLNDNDAFGIQRYTMGLARTTAEADSAVNAVLATLNMTPGTTDGYIVPGFASGGLLACPPFWLSGRVHYPWVVAIRPFTP